MSTRYAVTEAELAAWIETAGAPRYRVAQVVDALYRQRIPLEAASPLPRVLRTEIAEAFPLALDPIVESTGDDGQTVKWLWRCRTDGAQIETVLMRYPTRATVCVSSQAGCAMGCTFCATGQAGFVRHLDAGEIVEQVVRAAHASPQPVNNVVFMGMGEPLANYDATWAAVERLHGDLGLSARHLTISTVGIVPGIRRLATETLPVTLAISLHAPDDELRNTMIPVNRRYPLAEVIDAAAELGASRGRRVTFEYACIAGVNDLLDHAHALVRLLRPLGARGSHVNLIPLNDTEGYRGTAPVPVRMQAFATILRSGGLTATVRRNRGTDIDAACGQLRSRMGAESPADKSVAVRIRGDESTRMAP
ncbi:MAG: 23S rRNA (adenine(2503)-C(2))-methyltransferase RlmN [Acidimicrobiia bacterium]